MNLRIAPYEAAGVACATSRFPFHMGKPPLSTFVLFPMPALFPMTRQVILVFAPKPGRLALVLCRDQDSVYPVPQDAPHVSAGMNVLDLLKGDGRTSVVRVYFGGGTARLLGVVQALLK
jgi:hypothetical protein